MIDRVRDPVPVERLEAEFLRQLPVEGRCRLHPAPVEPDLGVAVVIERVAAHQLGQPLGGHMISYVGIAYASRDAGRAADRGQQSRLVDAIAVARAQGRAGAIGLGLHRRVVGVVAQIVAHRVIEAKRPLAVGPFGRYAARILDDFRMVRVDQRTRQAVGCEIRAVTHDIVTRGL